MNFALTRKTVMKNMFKFLLLIVIAISLISTAGCSCEKKDPGAEHMAPPAGSGGNTFGGPSNQNALKFKNVGKTKSPLANKLGPLLQKTMNLPKYKTSAEACKSFCEYWCPLAAKCNWKMMSKPVACHKLCVNPCTKGMLPKSFADCILGAKDCAKVKDCFTNLRNDIQNAAGSVELPPDTGKDKGGQTLAPSTDKTTPVAPEKPEK